MVFFSVANNHCAFPKYAGFAKIKVSTFFQFGRPWIKKEICKEKSMERGARRCNNFSKKAKRMLFGRIDNTVWSDGKEDSRWCKPNKVYDEITEKEIEEIQNRDNPDDDPVRQNGKYVWEAA